MEDLKQAPIEEKSIEVETKTEKIVKQKITPVYDLLESAINIWWKNLLKFVKVYLWGALFTLIPVVIMFLLILSTYSSLASSLFVLVPILILSGVCFLAVIYLLFCTYIGTFLLVKNNYQGNELEIFKETRKYFWDYFWLSILTAILIILWTLLLIIPGIIFSVFYSFAVYVFFFENIKGMAAIRKSLNLVKGYWWPVFGRFIVIGIALWIFTVIISIPLYFTNDKSYFYSFWSFIIQIINFLVGPISLLYFYQIYQDLSRIKK